MPKVKDLTSYLTRVTGLTPEERALWRADVGKLAKKRHPAAMLYFNNMYLWRSDKAAGIITKLLKQK